MEILYVCKLKKDEIHENFQLLAEHEQCFNGNYKIVFDETYQKFHMTHQDIIPRNFFGESISNISCIIGNNGSGKTRKIDFLIECLTDPVKKALTIIVCKENEEILLYKDKSIPEEILFECDDMVQKEIKEFYSEFTIMLYSNVFNNQHYLMNRSEDNFIDLSSIGLLNQTGTDEYENDRILNFFRNEVKQQIDFRRKFRSDNFLPFKIPTNLVVEMIPIDNIQLDDRFQNSIMELLEKMDKYPAQVDYVHQEGVLNLEKESLLGIFKLEIVCQVFISLLTNVYQGSRSVDNNITYVVGRFKEFFDGDLKEDILDEAFYTIREISNKLVVLYNDKYKIYPYIDFIGYLINVKDNLLDFIDVRRIKLKCFELKMDHKKTEEFLRFYFAIKSPREIFRFNWKMSSGEFALFSLFSRFNNILKANASVLIMIDEIDCLLHPKWQQKIVKYLIDVMPRIFENVQLQFLVTTHSPILLSDIPSNNVSYLTGYNNDFKETFGANISTIYFDSFALERGSKGEFAKSKIKDLIQALIDVTEVDGLKTVVYHPVNEIMKSLKLKSEHEIEQYINLIGEPIVKNKLLSIFEKCKGNVVS